jgi:hypothetical protein
MSTLDKFKKRVDRLWTYVKDRPAQVYQQMADYFSLGDVITVSILNDEDDSRSISVCDTPLRTGMFKGAWFTQFPLSLEVTDDASAAWMMIVTHADGSESTHVYDTSKIQPTLASCSPGDSITFIATDADMVDGIAANSGNRTVSAIYDATGKKIPAVHRGVNIILYTDGTHTKVIIE